MSDSVRILFKDGRAHRVVSEDTTISEVLDYYREKLGDRARQMDFEIREVPYHANL